VFSELNNLFDITLTKQYANICGITIEDLDKYFGEHIRHISTLEEFEYIKNVRNEILAWYDGYSWDSKTKLLNPFSLLSFFSQERFSSFWYASGTPKFLIDIIKAKPESYQILENPEITERALDIFDIKRMELDLLLFQTGYLTIKEVVFGIGSPVYRLEVPNLEVREAFNLHIIAELTEKDATFADKAYRQIHEALQTGNLHKMLDMLRALFASIPYQLHLDREAYYHSIFYAIMSVLGFDMDAEVSVSKGRIDAVLELSDKVYIIEFKYKDCPPDASYELKQKLFNTALTEGINQINERGYKKKYIANGKTIYQAAFAFLGRDDIEVKTEQL
jgi:hypothetical protein